MFNIALQDGDRYQLAIISGVGSAAEFRAAQGFVTEWVVRTHCTRLLVDLLGVTMAVDSQDEPSLLDELHRTLPACDKLAVVVTPAANQGHFHDGAEAHGARARRFSELGAAQAWLLRA